MILEERFKQKCKELKKRVLEVEESNEIATIALSRTLASIRRLRLEYSILLERLEDRAKQIPDGIVSFEEMACPPTPTILDDSLIKSKNGSKKVLNPNQRQQGLDPEVGLEQMLVVQEDLEEAVVMVVEEVHPMLQARLWENKRQETQICQSVLLMLI